MTKRTVDLQDSIEATSLLLQNPLEWRVRAVEEIVIDSGLSCHRKRSLQVAPLRGLLGETGSENTHALIVLPVGPMPRGPLQEFSIEGPLGEAILLPRVFIAEREADFLRRAMLNIGIEIDQGAVDLLSRMLEVPGGEHLESAHRSPRSYVASALGNAKGVDSATLAAWRFASEEWITALRSDGSTSHSALPRDSGLAYPWLAAALLYADGVEEFEVTERIRKLRDAGHRLAKEAEQENQDAQVLLEAVVDYAAYYDLMAEMEIPLDEPFLVKWTERRRLKISSRGWASQEVTIRDCLTNHLSVKSSDQNVRMVTLQGQHTPSGLNRVREDPEAYSLYYYGDRPYRDDIRIRMRLPWHQRLPAWLVVLSVWALILGLWIRPPSDVTQLPFSVGPLGLLLTLLLARENSTVASTLRRALNWVLFGSMSVLLCTLAMVFIKH